jgi:hypothetical protein
MEPLAIVGAVSLLGPSTAPSRGSHAHTSRENTMFESPYACLMTSCIVLPISILMPKKAYIFETHGFHCGFASKVRFSQDTLFCSVLCNRHPLTPNHTHEWCNHHYGCQYLVFPPESSRHLSILSFMLEKRFSSKDLSRLLKVEVTAALNSSKFEQPTLFTLLCTIAHTFSIGLRSGLFGGQLGKIEMAELCLSFHSLRAARDAFLCEGSLSCMMSHFDMPWLVKSLSLIHI